LAAPLLELRQIQKIISDHRLVNPLLDIFPKASCGTVVDLRILYQDQLDLSNNHPDFKYSSGLLEVFSRAAPHPTHEEVVWVSGFACTKAQALPYFAHHPGNPPTW
jgi:hypothetical protein